MWKRFAFACVPLLVLGTGTFAQNAHDFVNMFTTIMRDAVVNNARNEWSRISPNEAACIDGTLQQQGSSVGSLIQNGITPTDPRVANVRLGCRKATASISRSDTNVAEIGNLSSKPTIDCARGRTLTAHIICLDRTGATADWDLTSAYWARYFSLPPSDQRSFEQAQEHWLESLNQICSRTQNQQDCVVSAYRKRAAAYRSQLHGNALAESRLTPEQHAQIQQSLIKRGFLDDKPDGEFGAITRSAIKRFKTESGAPEGEFLTAQESQQLLEGKSTTGLKAGDSRFPHLQSRGPNRDTLEHPNCAKWRRYHRNA